MKYKLNVIVENPTTFDRIENVISILISPKLCRFFQLQKYQHFQHRKYYRIKLQRKRIKELLNGSTFDTYISVKSKNVINANHP